MRRIERPALVILAAAMAAVLMGGAIAVWLIA
jgi:hypothetical protein